MDTIGADDLTVYIGRRVARYELAISGARTFNHHVSPAEDPVASWTAAEVGTQTGARFLTTHWSVVLAAQGESAAANEALEKLCRTYWPPVYGFIRRQGTAAEEAKDRTQDFFALLLERRDLDAVRKEKGRLRSYLLTSLKHFLVSEHRRSTTAKRGKGQPLIPLDELSTGERLHMEPADRLSADRLYERRWALTLMEQVLRRLKDEYYAAGNSSLFDCLKELLPEEPDAPSRADIAAQLGMKENAVRQALYRFRQRYQIVLREEIAHTVAISSDIEDELRYLISVLRS